MTTLRCIDACHRRQVSRALACAGFIAFALSRVVMAAQGPTPPASPAHSSPTTAAHPAASAPSPLPGGATSVQETHGAWTVTCAQREGHKACAFSQEQVDKDSHNRILAFELNAVAPDLVKGVLVLPFGLSLEKGVSLQVDDANADATLRFRTCIPAGCVVDLNLDRSMVTRLKSGTKLAVHAVADAGPSVNFSVSLEGFAGAIDRTFALSR